MTRTLYLLRHAKSSRDDPGLADHDRPLMPRGIDAATRIARYMQDEGIRPDVVLCSSSRRTVDTLDLVRPALGAHVDIHIERDLYGADPEDVLQHLRRVDAAVGSVMVIGHNPTMQYLALGLASDADGDLRAMAQMREKFPTAALATLTLGDTTWAELGPDEATLTSVVLSRAL